jgi:hypothetical protein
MTTIAFAPWGLAMIVRKQSLVASLVLAAAITTASANSSSAAADGRAIAIIVAKSCPIDGLSFGDLKRLYLGSPIVSHGTTLVPLTYPKSNAARRGFDETVLGMSPDEVGRYWVDRRIRGQSGPPKSVESPDVAVRVVSKVNGVLGFVQADVASPDVKVIRIDGKLPGDPGYRVR